MARPLFVLLVITLAVWALIDVAQTPVSRIRRLSKSAWSLVVLIPIVGAVAWFLEGRAPVAAPPAQSRPLAPDDDPEFLRRLRERKRPDGGA